MCMKHTVRRKSTYRMSATYSVETATGEDVMTLYNELRRIGTKCAFNRIKKDEAYHDPLISRVMDERVREKLTENRDLTLEEVPNLIRNS